MRRKRRGSVTAFGVADAECDGAGSLEGTGSWRTACFIISFFSEELNALLCICSSLVSIVASSRPISNLILLEATRVRGLPLLGSRRCEGGLATLAALELELAAMAIRDPEPLHSMMPSSSTSITDVWSSLVSSLAAVRSACHNDEHLVLGTTYEASSKQQALMALAHQYMYMQALLHSDEGLLCCIWESDGGDERAGMCIP